MWNFEDQRYSFQRSGVANAPDDVGTMVVRGWFGQERHVESVVPLRPFQTLHDTPKVVDPKHKRVRARNTKPEPLVHDSDDELTYGIMGNH